MPTATLLKRDISSGWSFCEAANKDWLPAEVPGCVHTDLMRNGRIPDPFFGTNERDLQWIGERDWVYQASFDVSHQVLEEVHVELVFHGLDTYATVALNGKTILEANNMFRTWRVDCKGSLKPQNNLLSIRFRNVFDETLPRRGPSPYPLLAFATNDQADVKLAMYSRKAQFHFGWDWGPRLVTCGVWRPVVLEAWSGVRIHNVFVKQENVSAASAEVVSVIEMESDTAQSARVTASMNGTELRTESCSLRAGRNRVTLRGRLEHPTLWWTHGLGGQHLYDYRAVVAAGDNRADEYAARIGIRSLEIVRERDERGVSLGVRLNGVPVFMKGANYIPQDNFQNRVTPARHGALVQAAADAHMNMLRVWGGGIYEDDAFYDACDRHGILIWHDLQFACAMYPVDEPFLETVQAEIVDNVTRLRNHACIALYCGNNENELGWYLAWKDTYPESQQRQYEGDMRMLFEAFIPRILHELDPTGYYHPTSPTAGFAGRSPGEGDTHFWDVWHGQKPFETYPDNVSRFVSEYGFQSYPELSTVKRFSRPEDRELHSAAMLAHQRCTADERRDIEYGNRLIQTYLDRWYRTPKDFQSYLYVSQVMQADGVRVAMEAHRRARPYCMGSLYWQIDDCWPVASWSSIDYFGRWKALHYMARRSFAPLLISPVIHEDQVQFWIVSDRLEALQAELTVRVLNFDGHEVSGRSVAVTASPNAASSCFSMARRELTAGEDERRLVMACSLCREGEKLAEQVSYFRLPKELELSPPRFTVNLSRAEEGFSIELSARSLARAVMLSCGDQDGFFSDNYFELLPGGNKSVTLRTTLSEERVKQDLAVASLIDSYAP